MSHHGDVPFDKARFDSIQRALVEMHGKYPQGKLSEDDGGTLALTVGRTKEAVVLHFPKEVSWIGFDPDQAVEVALSMIQYAREIGLKKPFTIEI